MSLCKLTVCEFCAKTASNEPAPGGGSVSALAGALAASLASMVSELTLGRKKYAQYEEEMRAIGEKSRTIAGNLLSSVDEDTNAFNGIMDAIHMPKETAEQQAARAAALEEATKAASLVPLQTARLACEIFPLAQAVLERGNRNARSDAMVAAMLARTAVLGACLNVRVNLEGLSDTDFVASTSAEVERLEQSAREAEAAIIG